MLFSKVKVWYYRPDAYHPKVNPQYVFDKNGRGLLEKDAEPEAKHPLHKIYKIKIKNSMLEVGG